jgi:signal transduction histidine kinase
VAVWRASLFGWPPGFVLVLIPGATTFVNYWMLLLVLQHSDRQAAACARLRVSEERFRMLAVCSSAVVWSWSARENEIVDHYGSHSWQSFTGAPPGPDPEAACLGVVHPDDEPRVDAAWERSKALGTPLSEEFRIRRATGTYAWVSAQVVPIVGPSDRVDEWMGTLADISARKDAELAYATMLQRTITERDDFLCIAAHELRTPTTTTLLLAEKLLRRASNGQAATPPAPPPAQQLHRLVRSAERLKRLIELLLDLSRLQTHTLALLRERFDLAQSVRDVVAQFTEHAERSDTPIEVDVEHVCLYGDRARIEQIVTNLLENALKYAPGSPVRVTLAATRGEARLTVRDHGPGISLGDCNRVFERFERLASARRFGGLGVGLYVCRQLAEAHGGQVTAHPAPGGGALFVLTLPLAATQTSADDLRPPPASPASPAASP